MSKKILSIVFVAVMFLFCVTTLIPNDKTYKVKNIISPKVFLLNDKEFIIKDLETFDSEFSENNRKLSKNLSITEEEAFILGNLGKYWASNLLKNRQVYIKDNRDLIFNKFSYRTKFLYSGFCIKDSEPYSKEAFNKKLAEVRRAKFYVLDLDTDKVYSMKDKQIREIKNYLVLRKSHLPIKQVLKPMVLQEIKNKVYDKGKIKIVFTDSTSKIVPDRNCSSLICKEILDNINSAKSSIDMAIYGYSRTPVIEKALRDALKRGVNIRLIYDINSEGKNIYPDTDIILNLLGQNISDKNSIDSKNIMHNKFYIFDDKKLVTGSANLSHTDMSGFNSNSIISVESEELAKIYKQEFEQMYLGKFHSEKKTSVKQRILIEDSELEVYFSPQDKAISNAVLPLIKNAKKYIYIPTFVLTERRVTDELIKAKSRGVDVKILIDALNASIRHSKHKELRLGGIEVKTENYAGKMHSKSMIIDDEFIIIGSMNFSYSGENKNDENMVVIKNPQIAKYYKEFFMYQWNKIPDKWLKYNVRAEGKDSIGSCEDGIDNNYDGFVDKNDPACK